MKKADYLIIGAGIIGLTIAKVLLNKKVGANIIILEKEANVAYHSSGRNSGVLHAGFYYTSNSLKAKFTKEGNKLMTDYCKKNNLKINECKKVVVTKNETELESLFELERRGNQNGVDVEIIDEQQLKEIEPNAVTYKKALYSPTTSTIDPTEICLCLKNELQKSGVQFYFSEGYKKRIKYNTILTTKKQIITAEKIINTAGLYADKVAKHFGFSKNYTIIPFKGIYLKYSGDNMPINTNIYPVPNLRNPFLGVHYTVTVDNHVKIGPTSIPAFWRENYSGFNNLKISEFFHIISWETKLFMTDAFGFRKLAFEEIRKYNKTFFVNLAKKLVSKIDAKKFDTWTKPGIRAQLLDTRTKELVQDFIVEGDSKSIHVLNAVSPAFTSSFSFANWVVSSYLWISIVGLVFIMQFSY